MVQVCGAEVHRAPSADLQHQVRHPPMGSRHRLEPSCHLDVQVLLPQVQVLQGFKLISMENCAQVLLTAFSNRRPARVNSPLQQCHPG